MTARHAVVRTVHTALGPGLAQPGEVLTYRPWPVGLGTYGYRLDGGLLLGFPVLGEQHAERTIELHRRLAGLGFPLSGPLPDGLAAAAVWHGTVDLPGRTGVPVALAPDPYAEGYLPLHGALVSGLLDAEPMRTRFQLAYALARAVEDLAELGGVHGGLDASTMLIRVADRTVRITEVESATLKPDRGYVPLAVGAAAGYLAPELYDGVGEHPEAATGHADRWALAVALHEVLTGCHPYHFLPDLSPGVIGAYLRRRRWPDHDRAGSAAFALRYSTTMQALPAEIRDTFARTFQAGWRDGPARPPAADWLGLLGRWIGDPVVDDLRVDRGYVLLGESVTVSWRTRFADRVLLDGQVTGPANGSAALPLDRPRAITLYAVGPFGTAEARTARIEVLRVPRFGTVEVRAPLALRPGGGRPGDAILRMPSPPAVRHPPPAPLPARPGLPDPAVARLPAAAPRFGRPAVPVFPRTAATLRRFLTERHTP